MPAAAFVIWAVTLVVAYLALAIVVPLLLRIVHASRKIELYTRETCAASQGVTVHLESLPALERTKALLQTARGTGGEIAAGAEALADLLDRRARGAT